MIPLPHRHSKRYAARARRTLVVPALLAAHALLVAGCEGRESPAEVLRRVGEALAEGDRAAVYEYVDLDRLVPQMARELALADAQGRALAGSATAGEREGLEQGLRDRIEAILTRSERDSLPAAQRVLGPGYEFAGLGETQREGRTAVVEVRVRAPGESSPVSIPVRLERGDDTWRVVALLGLGQTLRRLAPIVESPSGLIDDDARPPAGGAPGERASVVDGSSDASALLLDDLRRLVAAQQAYHERRGRYATSRRRLDFAPSPGVRIDIDDAGRRGWRATARHPQAPSLRCGVAVGDEAVGAEPGVPVCAARPPR